MTIELGKYGLMIDSHFFYIALSWEIIILSVVAAILYKVIKRKRSK